MVIPSAVLPHTSKEMNPNPITKDWLNYNSFPRNILKTEQFRVILELVVSESGFASLGGKNHPVSFKKSYFIACSSIIED